MPPQGGGWWCSGQGSPVQKFACTRSWPPARRKVSIQEWRSGIEKSLPLGGRKEESRQKTGETRETEQTAGIKKGLPQGGYKKSLGKSKKRMVEVRKTFPPARRKVSTQDWRYGIEKGWPLRGKKEEIRQRTTETRYKRKYRRQQKGFAHKRKERKVWKEHEDTQRRQKIASIQSWPPARRKFSIQE